MGTRSAEQTAAILIARLLEERNCEQSELARHLGMTVQGLRKRLRALAVEIPLHREEEDGRVIWSVPPTWIPGGLRLSRDDLGALLRLLSRLSRSDTRDRLLRSIASAAMRSDPSSEASIDVPSRPIASTVLDTVEIARERRAALRVSYRSEHEATERSRHLSPQYLQLGDRPRVAAVCHESGTLKWFRLDSVRTAALDRGEPWREVDRDMLDAFVRGSFDGWHGDRDETLVFVVRHDAWERVERLLPTLRGVHRTERLVDGVRVTIDTRGRLALARFLAGQGDGLVRVESASLREALRAVVEAALGALSDAPDTERR